MWLLTMRNREFKVEVRDASFQPAIIVIEEGDRIWWEWTKDKVAEPNTFCYRNVCMQCSSVWGFHASYKACVFRCIVIRPTCVLRTVF